MLFEVRHMSKHLTRSPVCFDAEFFDKVKGFTFKLQG